MIFRRRVAFFALLFVVFSKVHPQNKNLTIDDAVKTALENNIVLKRNNIQLEAAERSKKNSWNSASPSVSVGAGFSKSNQNFDDNYTAYLQGGINVTLSTNLYTDIKNAALKYQAGELSYESAKRTVEMNVRKAFYNLLYQDENVALQKANLETARTQYETNQRKYNQGAISQLDVLTSQVNYEKIIPAVQSAQIARDNDMALFKQMLGLEQGEQIALSGSLDDIVNALQIYSEDEAQLDKMKAYIGGLESKNPEVLALEKNLQIAKNSMLSSRFSAYGPTVRAGWTYQPTWSKAAGRDSSGPDDRGALSLSLSIPLDGLFPWSKGADSIQNAKDNVSDLELQLQDKKTSVQVATESGIRSIGQIAETIKTLRSSVTLAERTYQMTQEAYNRGSRNFTELLSARNSLEQARLNLKQQAYNLAAAILSLENSLGIPFGTLFNTSN